MKISNTYCPNYNNFLYAPSNRTNFTGLTKPMQKQVLLILKFIKIILFHSPLILVKILRANCLKNLLKFLKKLLQMMK